METLTNPKPPETDQKPQYMLRDKYDNPISIEINKPSIKREYQKTSKGFETPVQTTSETSLINIFLSENPPLGSFIIIENQPYKVTKPLSHEPFANSVHVKKVTPDEIPPHALTYDANKDSSFLDPQTQEKLNLKPPPTKPLFGSVHQQRAAETAFKQSLKKLKTS